ncbi:MAG: DUF6912 family protein [Propioniciclava sp.]
MLVFVPLAAADLVAWATAGPRDVAGFAATPGFLQAFGLDSPVADEAELTLLEIAGLASLLSYGRRLVAVCETVGEPGEPAELGAVQASAVPWRRVSSLFADDADGASRATQVRTKLGPTNLVAAWDASPTVSLVEEIDLLWHGAGEWDRLASPSVGQPAVEAPAR